MIVTKKEKQELMVMGSANLIISTSNFVMTSAYITGDIIGGLARDTFKGADYVGEKLAEKFIKKNNINSDWD